jgi:hypothetical protein
LLLRERAYESVKIRRQKQARFRWFLAYTIINNFSLFHQRKQTQAHLTRIARNYFIDEQEDPSISDSGDEHSPQRSVKSYLGMCSPMSHDTYARQSNTLSDSDVFEYSSTISQQSSIQTPLKMSTLNQHLSEVHNQGQAITKSSLEMNQIQFQTNN